MKHVTFSVLILSAISLHAQHRKTNPPKGGITKPIHKRETVQLIHACIRGTPDTKSNIPKKLLQQDYATLIATVIKQEESRILKHCNIHPRKLLSVRRQRNIKLKKDSLYDGINPVFKERVLSITKQFCPELPGIELDPKILSSAETSQDKIIFIDMRQSSWNIGHEAVHFTFNDYGVSILLWEEINRRSSSALWSLYDQMLRLQEIRANFFSAILSAKYAKGYLRIHPYVSSYEGHPVSNQSEQLAKTIVTNIKTFNYEKFKKLLDFSFNQE